MLSLAKSARRYKGPSRNTNLLDSNAVPVIHLSTENTRLRSEKEKLEIENAIQKFKLANLQQTINNYMEQNTITRHGPGPSLVWAASHKNSAEAWKRQFAQAFRRLAKLSGPLEALSTLGRDEGNDANTLNPTFFFTSWQPQTRNPPSPGGNSSSRLSLCSLNSQGFLCLSPHSAGTRETTRIPSTQPMTRMPHCLIHGPAYHAYQP